MMGKPLGLSIAAGDWARATGRLYLIHRIFCASNVLFQRFPSLYIIAFLKNIQAAKAGIAVNDLSQTLIAFAMQKYYEETAASAGYNKALYADIDGW